MSRGRKVALGAVVVVLVAAVTAILGVRHAVLGSLPQLEGERAITGLGAEVVVERDAHGVPRVLARSELDAIRALGFLHAQERFFQMDLLRRRAAGELSELVGAAALDADRSVRVHRLRERARRAVEAGDAAQRERLDAYVEGVEEGLRAVGTPPEYRLLRRTPTAWRGEDTFLVLLAMYLDLQDADAALDRGRGTLRDALPEEVVEFLLPAGSPWDTPLVGDAWETPPVPGPDAWDPFRDEAADAEPAAANELAVERYAAGSNNWAIAGARSDGGRAIVANDMHLGLGLPNIWYRASLAWDEADGRSVRVTGVTLAGLPGVIAGSSGELAWGFTNTHGDWSDLVVIDAVPDRADAYRTPAGVATVETHVETIAVAGGDDETLAVRETIWGPIVGRDARGRELAARWVGHDFEALNLVLIRLFDVRTLEDAVELAHRAGMPAQNVVLGTSDGRIGWTIAGRIPRRYGHDGRFPVSWADGARGWDGWLASDEVPRVLDPPSGVVWTANARTVDRPQADRIGDGGYALGARAGQIRDALLALDGANEEDLLAVQLDDRALFLAPWRERLRALLAAAPADPRRAELARVLESSWSGRASIDSVGYRMVRGWLLTLAPRVFDPLTAGCRELDPEFDYLYVARWVVPLERLLDERPRHLLHPRYGDWDALQLEVVDALLDEFLHDGVETLDAFTWGDRNRVVVAHPMSRALPGFLRARVDLPAEPLPGDRWMPRVQGVTFGASERFVVSPGAEERGLFHMPGGQSGHFASPYYTAGHRDWAEGRAAPFLPGETAYRLRLVPRN